MRALPAVVVGALLILGLTPAAAVAESVSAPAGTSASPTESPKPDPKPEPKPEDEIPYGTFSIDPESGPAGTVVTATSETDCPLKQGGAVVDVLMLSKADFDSEDGEPAVRKTLEADEEGSWSAELKVPAGAKAGDVYVLIAACFGPDEEDFVEPCLIYEPVEFEVTKAEEPVEPEEPEAPVASPVDADPTYTG